MNNKTGGFLMRKVLSVLLVCSLFCVGLLFPQNTLAGHGNQKKGLPPGLAKKLELKGKGINQEFCKGFKLTRSQLAVIIARKDASFEDFKESKEIQERVNDWQAIPEKDRKAVSFVISKQLMKDMYKYLPNGKIVFQPNRPITIEEFLKFLDLKESPQVASEVILEGTVRLVETIGNKTWIVVKTSEGLFSAYFTESTVPSNLVTGVQIKIKVDKTSYEIMESSLNRKARNLLTTNQSNIEKDLLGFSSSGLNTYAGATLRRTTSEKWQGKNSLQVTTTGYNAWQGVNVNYQGEEIAGPLTFSFYVKGSAGTPLRVIIYDQDNVTYPIEGLLKFTASGKWERKTVTFTPTKSSNDLALQITLDNSTRPTVFYLDGLQLEKGSKATTWLPGGF
jgi:hypothetical protein